MMLYRIILRLFVFMLFFCIFYVFVKRLFFLFILNFSIKKIEHSHAECQGMILLFVFFHNLASDIFSIAQFSLSIETTKMHT